MTNTSSADCLEAAIDFQAMGWSVIPFRNTGTKSPALASWKEFQQDRLSPEDLRILWRERPWLNVGAVTGAISNISVVDFDGKHAFELLTSRGYSIPKTRAHKSPHGWHLIYRYNPTLRTDTKLLVADCGCTKSCAIDIRGDAACIVLPPSVFNGNPYRMGCDLPIAEWPDPPVELCEKPKVRRKRSVSAVQPFNGTSPYARIKSAVSITDVAALLGVRLESTGNVERGLCPLHDERTPSFTVWPDQGSWWCFGCGRGSDVIDLLRESGRLREFLEVAR